MLVAKITHETKSAQKPTPGPSGATPRCRENKPDGDEDARSIVYCEPYANNKSGEIRLHYCGVIRNGHITYAMRVTHITPVTIASQTQSGSNSHKLIHQHVVLST